MRHEKEFRSIKELNAYCKEHDKIILCSNGFQFGQVNEK